MTATSGGSSSNLTGYVFLPQSLENYGYDLDGNLTSDGRWTYTWDAENQLTKMESLSSAPTASKRKLEFEYDYRGRRISKKVYTHNGTTCVLQSTYHYVYDGWNLIAETVESNWPLRTFMWGLDLSGSLQGAGGVGGLLKWSYHPTPATQQFMVTDGNGNITGVVATEDGTVLMHYEYSPFGETIRASGTLAANPFRFSTKYTDVESQFVYYGRRYYNPSTGRWPSRDPIGEAGGLNSYGFVLNNPIQLIDFIGLNGYWPPAVPPSIPWDLPPNRQPPPPVPSRIFTRAEGY